jgi:hypothetical protein
MIDTRRFEMRSKLEEIIRRSEDLVPSETTKMTRELVEHHEFGIALEILCEQLHEFDARISPELYTKIREIGEQMHLSSDLWEVLRDSVAE